MTAPFDVTRLLQNPLGAPAPEGAAGDLVRVSDGTTAIYLTPAEYDRATDSDLRYLLAQGAHSSRDASREQP